jgi:hypothetical protein
MATERVRRLDAMILWHGQVPSGSDQGATGWIRAKVTFATWRTCILWSLTDKPRSLRHLVLKPCASTVRDLRHQNRLTESTTVNLVGQ